MPGKNGFDTTQEIVHFFSHTTPQRKGGGGSGEQQLPVIIAYSAFIDNATITLSKQVGMQDFINKPASLQQLEKLLVKWIRI